MQILLANPRGFCAGVDRAISIVENALTLYGAPIYVRHEVVHNRYVVDSLRKRGAIFIEQISEVPDGAILIFSAPRRVAGGTQRSEEPRPDGIRCHLSAGDQSPYGSRPRQPPRRRVDSDWPCRPSGSRRHHGTVQQPARGMYLVESPEDVLKLEVKNDARLSFMTQTTLSVDDTSDVIDALRARFPKIVGPRKDDICYATTNRQEAVRALAEKADVVLVVGSKNSSNS